MLFAVSKVILVQFTITVQNDAVRNDTVARYSTVRSETIGMVSQKPYGWCDTLRNGVRETVL